MNDNIAYAIGKRVKFTDTIVDGIKPITYPAATREKKLPKSMVSYIKIFGDVGNVIKLKRVMP